MLVEVMGVIMLVVMGAGGDYEERGSAECHFTTCSSIIVGKNCEPGLAREPKVADTYTNVYCNN